MKRLSLGSMDWSGKELEGQLLFNALHWKKDFLSITKSILKDLETA